MDCHKCGCNRLNLTDAGSDYGRAWAVFECDFCHVEIRIGRRGKKRPEFVRTVCPECGGSRAPVKSHGKTPAKVSGVRYHKCLDCGASFKTVERK